MDPDTITTSNLLAFADIAPVEVPAVPLAQHVAEKVQAYTRRYGTQRQPSTRHKDLVDIMLISGSEPMDAEALREALERTFEQRARQRLPKALPAPPDSWRRPFALLASEVGIDPNLDAAFKHASALVDPVFAKHTSGRWDPAAMGWQPSPAGTT